jgi:putative aldouronate transport system substrate-binding protein
MYDQGLIDKDIALVKGQQGYDKFASGKAAALLEVGYGNVNNLLLPRWKQLYPDTSLTDAVKRVKYFPAADGNKYYCTFKTYWSESYFSATVDDKKMDRIMRMYDYLLQPDTKEFYRYGVKDVDYTKDGDKITLKTTNEELLQKQPGAGTLGQLVEFDDQYFYDPNNSAVDASIREAAVKDLEVAKSETREPDYEVKLTYVSTPTKDKFTIFDHDFMLNIMMGNKPVEDMWNSLLKDYESKGLSKMIDEVNEKAKAMGLN